MNVRSALKSQYHGALAMLKDCIENCPDELWVAGEDPRKFWRIAYHALFFAHLYLVQDEAAFVPWKLHRDSAIELWGAVPEDETPYTRSELLGYLCELDGMIDSTVDALDLDRDGCGYHWYTMRKLDHEILSIRHINQHVGQLSERLMGAGIDTRWISS